MSAFQHDGSVIIVTGGTRGIGEAVVRRLVSEGAVVHATYISNPDRANTIVQSLDGARGTATYHQVDVADEAQVTAFVESVRSTNGRIDGLVNNAGITRDGLIVRMSGADWHDVIETNLSGPFYTCKAVARPMMSQRSGRIVNVGSIVGLGGNAGQVNYSAAKAGLVGLTRSLARELASRNVLVNCVAPGYIETDMTGKLNDEQRAAFVESIPLRRVGTPDDVAAVISFLLSSHSAYITGQVLNVDGGLAM